MDKKNSNALDPKLKEAYDRVMGFSVPQSVPHAKPQATPQPPKPPHSAPSIPQAIPNNQPLSNYQVTTAPITQTATSQQTHVPAATPADEKKGSNAILLIVMLISGVLLVFYALFWIRFLDLQLF
jgi:hypothetical protein